MPTTPLAGDRSRRARSPRDITGRRYEELHREQQEAKGDLANIDVTSIRHMAYTSGHAAGFEAGFVAGWDALADHLVEIGVLDPDDEPEVLGSPEAE